MPEPSNVALITAYGWAGISSPVLNTMTYLTGRGIHCDQYYDYDKWYDESQINRPPIISPLQQNIVNRYPFRRNIIWRAFGRMVGLSALERAAVEFALFPIRRPEYKFAIGYDPSGAIRAYCLSRLRKFPYLIHSLEISEKPPASRLEMKAFAASKAVLTTDEQRGEIIARQYQLPEGKVIPLPNSSMGVFDGTKGKYFRDKWAIPDDVLIVLCTGSLVTDHCVDKIIESVPRWPDGFVLVLHGWALAAGLRDRVAAVNAQFPRRIFVSEEMLPFDKKATVFRSADIGFVTFNDASFNHRFGAGSAGKLYDFCQAGVPVLANDIPGMRKLVEGNRIGVVFGSFYEIGPALQAIKHSQGLYRPGCEQFFVSNEFGKAFEAILRQLRLL